MRCFRSSRALDGRADTMWLGVGLMALTSGAAVAQDLPSADQAGAGGMVTSDHDDNTSIVFNPAAIGFTERYDFQALGVAGPSGRWGWSGSALDARTNDYLAFGLAYHGTLGPRPLGVAELPGWAAVDEDVDKGGQFHDITVALAVPFSDRRFAFGVNGTVSIYDLDFLGTGVTGNLDLAFATRPFEYLSIGLVGRDILPVSFQSERPATLSFGVRGGKEELFVGMVEADARLEGTDTLLERFVLRAGVEGTVKVVQLRAGWDWDGLRDTHRVSWGIGIFSEQGSLSYAMQVPIVTEDFRAELMTHTLSLTVKTKLGDRNAEEQPIRWENER